MDTLEYLQADHKRLRNVLEKLKRELAAGEAANLQFMQDLVTSYSDYFNRVHHPLEDHLFEYVLRRETSRHHDTERALMQHGELIRRTSRFLARLDQALHGGIVRRDDLLRAGWQFLEANLEHMALEERTAFTRAREHLSADDWAAIESHTCLHHRADVRTSASAEDRAGLLQPVH